MQNIAEVCLRRKTHRYVDRARQRERGREKERERDGKVSEKRLARVQINQL